MSTENLAPQVISRLMREIGQLVKKAPDGIEYCNENDNCTDIKSPLTRIKFTSFEKNNNLRILIQEFINNI